MINKLSGRQILTAILMVATGFAGHAQDFLRKPDTLKMARVLLLHSLDSVNIGPEYTITGNLVFVDENQLPPFHEVLCRFEMPFRGKVISRYGIRSGRMHMGTDIKLYPGDTVRAVFEGRVRRACRYYGYGNLVVVSHPHGLETYYAHLSGILANVGDTVHTGQVIGLGGRTGRATTEHLHFEIREDGKAYNPELVYDFGNCTIRPEVTGTEALAELIRNPKTGENIEITSRGNSYVQEMSSLPMVEYVIKAGDSLWEIARRFNTSVTMLCKYNNLTSRSILRTGKILKIFRNID